MTERITAQHVKRFCAALNKAFKSPERYTASNGKAAIGHFHCDQQSGTVAVVRTMNDGGGVQTIVRGGSARECYNQIHAWFNGWLYAEEEQRRRNERHPRIAARAG